MMDEWLVPEGVGARRLRPLGSDPADDSPWRWRQDEEEVELTVPLESKVTKREVLVKFLEKRLVVRVKDDVLIDAKVGGRVDPDGSSWSFGKDCLVLTLAKADDANWKRLVVRDPPSCTDLVFLTRDAMYNEYPYWSLCEDPETTMWPPHDEAQPLSIWGASVLAGRAIYSTWRYVVDAVLARTSSSTDLDEALARRWCYMHKRHSMDTFTGYRETLVKAAGGPFPREGLRQDESVVLTAKHRPVIRAAMLDHVLNWLVPPLCTVESFDETEIIKLDNWTMDLALRNHVPRRCGGDQGYESTLACIHKAHDVDGTKWLTAFLEIRSRLFEHLHLKADDTFPLRLHRQNRALVRALIQAKADAPPCVDDVGIAAVRAFVKEHAEPVILHLLPTSQADEPHGFDSPAARGNLSGYDLRLDDWLASPGGLDAAGWNPQDHHFESLAKLVERPLDQYT